MCLIDCQICCSLIAFVYLSVCPSQLVLVIVLILAVVNLLGHPEVTANTYCKSRKLPNTDTQDCSTDLR